MEIKILKMILRGAAPLIFPKPLFRMASGNDFPFLFDSYLYPRLLSLSMLVVKKSAVAACLAGAQSAYPNEFIGLLEGERSKNADGKSFDLLITRVIIPPGIGVSGNSASFSSWMVPMVSDVWGSFHSHPGTSVPRPSRADLRAFGKEGGAHLIAAEPFDANSLAAFDSKGKRIPFKIVP